ncbi:hypothetical protein N7491_004827 [Penicillium cf. griseofulvum]|nr:hypothetical protein N7491_004827 [Penicillium cf. griseofulvum]
MDELVRIFMDDKRMAMLFREAISERSITPACFVRNFRRLLKRFAANLKREARKAIEFDVAKLVLSTASLVADEIGRTFEHQYSQPDTPVQLLDMHVDDEVQAHLNEELHDMSSDEEDENGLELELDENLAALAPYCRSFIKESDAFQKLREEFTKFVLVSQQNRGLETKSPEVRSWFQRWMHFVCMALGWEIEIQPETTEWTLIARLHLSIPFLPLTKIGLLEERILEGHQRFRWTNRHGKKLYDDYIEHEPGALQALQQYLDATTVPTAPTKTIPASNQGQTSSRAAMIYTPSSISTSASIPTSVDITDQSTDIPKNIKTGSTQQDIEMAQGSYSHTEAMASSTSGVTPSPASPVNPAPAFHQLTGYPRKARNMPASQFPPNSRRRAVPD